VNQYVVYYSQKDFILIYIESFKSLEFVIFNAGMLKIWSEQLCC